MKTEIKSLKSNVELLKPLALRWRQEYNASLGIETDEDTYMARLARFAAEKDNIVLVLTDKNEIYGYMGIGVFDSPLGRQKIANEHYWYVVPEKRGISSLRMLKAAYQWSKEKGCSHLIMNASVLAGALHDKTCRLYEKYGMKKFETSYITKVI